MAAQNSTKTQDDHHERRQNAESDIQAPIVGYEIVESRKRFTVYQISVNLNDGRTWFVFRRYSDFARLDEDLRKLYSDGFPEVELPPKKYFGDNFAEVFIEMRKHSLQRYLASILRRQEICWTQPVIDFLCLDDPPGPYDSLEESRAFIENLEDTVSDMKQKYHDINSELRFAKTQLRSTLSHRQALLVALRAERVLNGKPSHDNDDVALISEYLGHPEVTNLNFKNFGNEENMFKSKPSRHYTSTVASQWDLRFTRANSRESPPETSRRARSVSDLPDTPGRRSSSRHLPSNDKASFSVLDKFMRQSTEALQQIRLTIRQKLGRWEDESNVE